jgi:hypothetical protein
MPISAGRYEFEISAEVIRFSKEGAMSFVKVCKLLSIFSRPLTEDQK